MKARIYRSMYTAIPRASVLIMLLSLSVSSSDAWTPSTSAPRSDTTACFLWGRNKQTDTEQEQAVDTEQRTISQEELYFQDFVDFLKAKQDEIVQQLEEMEHANGAKFTRDAWGMLDDNNTNNTLTSGGITRVLQNGNMIEKGACSLTLIEQGILTADRAATIRARDQAGARIQAGDTYAAAALSMVLHTRSPLVPTFRSDVRIFLVRDEDRDETLAWFGGGADLTPYYLNQDDITYFHRLYRDLCQEHFLKDNDEFSYESMKKACDEYFYLPARSEHRGTGGIFFDDMDVDENTLAFCKGVANTWMPSWIPIVEKRQNESFTSKQKQWQLLRRGRYLEFNLLYDRGVKFGLAQANPRVEGVMVSAPPLIAYEYNHVVEPGSPEDELVQVLKEPRDWVLIDS